MRHPLKIAAILLFASVAGHAAPGIEDLYLLHRLPSFKTSIEVASISSYDRTGGNDDGFSGKYSFIRKEGDRLVIADLNGPGVIYRIWTPTPSDDLVEFFFDGEARPRISLPLRKIFAGDEAPFLEPLSGSGAGGFFSYVPLAYEKSCKITVRAQKVLFYQINYARYPESAGIETYPGAESPELLTQLQRARNPLFADAAAIHTQRSTVELSPGRPAVVFETSEPGRIVSIRMSPAAAFDRSVVLRIFWDGEAEPSVNVPAGDFFGYAWGEPAVKSLLLGTGDGVNYIRFPMPFERAARIELVAEDPTARAAEIHAEIEYTNQPRTAEEGRFHAIWRRENPTTIGKPFTFLEAAGRGHLVGAILQAQGSESGRTSFFEGDDQTTIDGKLVIHGTGSEDFFNGGWYNVPGRWNGPFSHRLSGALDYDNPLARTGGYRFFIGDAYAFRESILQTIEHAPTRNSRPTDYAAVTFFYADDGIQYDRSLPPVDERSPHAVSPIRFAPGWNVPIRSFSLGNATLTKKTEKFGERNVRYLSMHATGEDTFGPHHISFECNLPRAASYRVSIEAIRGPSAPTVQLSRHEVRIGRAVELGAPTRAPAEPMLLGTFQFDRGSNELFLKLTPGDLELIHLIFEER